MLRSHPQHLGLSSTRCQGCTCCKPEFLPSRRAVVEARHLEAGWRAAALTTRLLQPPSWCHQMLWAADKAHPLPHCQQQAQLQERSKQIPSLLGPPGFWKCGYASKSFSNSVKNTDFQPKTKNQSSLIPYSDHEVKQHHLELIPLRQQQFFSPCQSML